MLLKDHHNLTSDFKQPTLNARQDCWVDFLSEFDFEIRHLKGKQNRVVDALSRKVNSLYEISFSEFRINFYDQSQEIAMQDVAYNHLW